MGTYFLHSTERIIIIRKSDPPRGPCDEVTDLEVTGFFAEAVEAAAAVALLTRVGVTKQS